MLHLILERDLWNTEGADDKAWIDRTVPDTKLGKHRQNWEESAKVWQAFS